jgi:hypothetical protein
MYHQACWRLFDAQSEVVFNTALPWGTSGGSIKGHHAIKTHFARLHATMKLDAVHIEKVFECAESFTVALKIRLTGSWRHRHAENATRAAFDFSINTLIKSNERGVVHSMLSTISDEEQLLKRSFWKRAELLFNKYQWQFFKSDMIDESSALWDNVDDDIVFTWNAPSEIGLPSRVEGKQAAKDFAATLARIMAKSPLKQAMRKMPHAVLLKTVKVIKALDCPNGDSKLWFEAAMHGKTIMIGTQRYNAAGKLIRHDITYATALKPWMIFAKPSSSWSSTNGEASEQEQQQQQQQQRPEQQPILGSSNTCA